MSKKSSTDELIQISVPTKKIVLEIDETEKIEIILKPFKQRHFATAIEIINKYFDQFNSVRTKYLSDRKAIFDKYPDEATRTRALKEFDAGFSEEMEIAKAILSGGGEGIGEDIKTIVQMSIYKAVKVLKMDSGTERSPIDLELEDISWGECLVLLGSTIGLNINFFNQNSKAMNLRQVLNQDEPGQSPKPQAGEKSSADSSQPTTALAK